MIKTTPRRRGGFTIVELLVTIGIILVLLGILLPTILAVRRTADRKRTEADLQTITQALEAYKQVFNDYPRQIRPDWNVTQPGRATNGPERVLAKYLLGWDPETNSIDDQGVRVVKVVTTDGKRAANNAKKWGPYLPPDRFKVDSRGVPNIDVASDVGVGGKLLDRYGTEIQYYPKWNSRTDLTKPGSIIGSVTRAAAGAGGNPRALFNLYDGIAYNGNDYKSVAHLDHLLYMLGDGEDVVKPATPPSKLPPLGPEVADFPNNKLDPEKVFPTGEKLPAEQLTFQGEFILVSAGPDKVWGLNDFYDPTNTNKGGANRKRSKVDDVYNISR